MLSQTPKAVLFGLWTLSGLVSADANQHDICPEGSEEVCSEYQITVGSDNHVTYTTNGTGAATTIRSYAPDGCEYGTVIIEEPDRPDETCSPTEIVYKPGTTAGASTIPIPPGCTRGCTETIISTIVPSDGLQMITEIVSGAVPGTETIAPSPGCEPDCTETVRVTKPDVTGTRDLPDRTITSVVECTVTADSCADITIVPPSDCRRPCTTTIIQQTPPLSQPAASTTSPPDVSTTILGECTTETICEDEVIPPAADCEKPCTTTFVRRPSGYTSTPDEPPTTTEDPTPEETPTPTQTQCAEPTCDTGIQRARYPNPFGGAGDFDERFNTDYFKETEPDEETVVTSFLDKGEAGGENLSFQFRTWFYSCTGGEFSFQIVQADEIALAWFGDLACGDFTKANNQTGASYEREVNGYGPGEVFTVDIPPETYYPIRSIWINAGGRAILDLKVTGPEGQDLSGDDFYFYQAPCDGSREFVAFGTEEAEGEACRVPADAEVN